MSVEARGPSLPAAPSDGERFWNHRRVADALANDSVAPPPRGRQELGRVWTDTRTIQPGDLFVALKGDRFDAHDFLRAAVEAGAAAVVVSNTEAARGIGVPAYVVRDTRAALGSLARYRRRAWNGPVVAVVGANGKTSTKELIRAALGSRLEVHATRGNLNNLVGVPQTLLAIPAHADVAVIEMGTNAPGEIASLRDIVEPNVAVVTSIEEEHLEGLGDLDGVLREEMSACDGVAVAIVPPTQPEVIAAARARARRVVVAGNDMVERRSDRGSNTAGARERLAIDSWSLDAEGRGRLVVNGVEVSVPLRGVHNLRNAALALAVADELGIGMEDAARGIAGMELPSMRVAWEQVGRVTLVNDAYNSNPGSARAALELLAHLGSTASGRQRVAVLGTMLELGPSTARLHDEVARAALAANIDLVAGVGEFQQALERVGAPKERVVTSSEVESLWPALVPRLAGDAIILLKASRGVRLERLVPLVTSWARQAP